MNTYEFLTPVDNTKLDALVNETHEKGYSEYSRLFIPNQGTADNGDMVHFFASGAISVMDRVVVDKSQIFARNGYLVKPGIIVEKYYINKKAGKLLLGDEKYFRVIDSNIDEVKQNSLVIVQAGQGHRFNIDKQEYFYVQPDKILIVLSTEGIKPGPFNMLLKAVYNVKMLGLKTHAQNKGDHNGNTYYFDDALYNIVIANDQYTIVAKKNIKIVS